MTILAVLFLIIGILCLLYFGIITIYAGIGTAFAGFWLVVGAATIIYSGVLRFFNNHETILNKYIKGLTIIFLIGGIIIFTLVEGVIIYNGRKAPSPEADYLIVLGAQIRGTRITNSLKKRLDTAIIYLNHNEETLVIVSGGKGPGEDITEALAMKTYLLDKGIKEERIIEEGHSTNTYENIIYSQKLLKQGENKIIVVSNSFHIYRAKSIARKQGIHSVQGLGAPSDKILTINYYVREAFALFKDKLFGNM